MTSSGQIAKLKGELAMTKKLCQELKKHQGETDEFVQVTQSTNISKSSKNNSP